MRATTMSIERALVVPTWGGYFNDDLAAIRAGAKREGFTYVGDPVTPGFSRVRHPTEAAAVVLVLSDGQTVSGDCLTVQYAGAGGRSPRFSHATQIEPLRTFVRRLEGCRVETFLELCGRLESID